MIANSQTICVNINIQVSIEQLDRTIMYFNSEDYYSCKPTFQSDLVIKIHLPTFIY